MAALNVTIEPPSQPAEEQEQLLQIGEVAEKLGLTQRALRYYEERGLIPPPSRMSGGFRLYTPDELARIERVIQLKNVLGFSLEGIKRIFDAEETKEHLRDEYRQHPDAASRHRKLEGLMIVTEEQVAIINSRIAALEQMRAELEEKLNHYRTRLAEIERETAQS
jgi:MerR family transcriptional regulator, repressor of the yfmOP operon